MNAVADVVRFGALENGVCRDVEGGDGVRGEQAVAEIKRGVIEIMDMFVSPSQFQPTTSPGDISLREVTSVA